MEWHEDDHAGTLKNLSAEKEGKLQSERDRNSVDKKTLGKVCFLKKCIQEDSRGIGEPISAGPLN